MNLTIKGIRKLVKYGLITLVGFSLFIGCGDPYYPVEEVVEDYSEIVFELDSGLELDVNGYYHLPINESKWQTLHRISGHVYRDSMPVNVVHFSWISDFYWTIGDTFGYVIANNGLTDDLVYVAYDTTYITWFDGTEVPIVNGSSYSREDGEVNTMIAPIRTMKGDTSTIYYQYIDNYYGDVYYGEFYVIFD